MRTETTTRVLYTFDELSDEAKERARDDYRRAMNSGGPEDFDFCIEDAATVAGILGIDLSTHTVKLYGGGTRQEPRIFWSLGYPQSDGAGFDARYRYAKGSCAAIRQHASQDAELHRIADALAKVQRRHFYRLWADVECSNQYYNVRASVETDGREDVPREDAEEIEEALRDFARWIYNQLRREDEYRMSDEGVNDYLANGDEEFTEDGRRA